MKTLLASLTVLTGIAFTSVSAAEDADAKVKASFDSFAKLVIGGTWTREDDPTYKHTYKWAIQGKFLHRVARGGPLADVGMIGIDPDKGQMTFWLFNQDGTVGELQCKQESDGVWGFSYNGEGPDGQHRYRGRASRVDENTIKEVVIENIVNGKSEKTGEFTWNRTRKKK